MDLPFRNTQDPHGSRPTSVGVYSNDDEEEQEEEEEEEDSSLYEAVDRRRRRVGEIGALTPPPPPPPPLPRQATSTEIVSRSVEVHHKPIER